MNIDGSARGNPGKLGGRGLARDDNGKFLFAFASGYGWGSNNRVELRAAYDGLLLSLNKGFRQIQLESDSKLVIDLLSGRSSPSWQGRPWVARIKNLMNRGNLSLSFIHREGNSPANGLAHWGGELQESRVIDRFEDLPASIRGLIFLDWVGLGAVRAVSESA
ncbi:uncharacterized protein LOC131231762 [Magnolia sinica]|uniref:uncharacterized protein LOC131231762 n=1 Tax=Magnolia sinica TaxID=86752 RepID=UPI0026582DBE|nr:uncharacterized protein LOC131231762 [Magnolia sinica]